MEMRRHHSLYKVQRTVQFRDQIAENRIRVEIIHMLRVIWLLLLTSLHIAAAPAVVDYRNLRITIMRHRLLRPYRRGGSGVIDGSNSSKLIPPRGSAQYAASSSTNVVCQQVKENRSGGSLVQYSRSGEEQRYVQLPRAEMKPLLCGSLFC